MPKNDKPVLEPFNPLDKRNLGESVADALLETEARPLPPEPFIGAGMYAIYYTGSFSAYGRLSEVNRNGQFRCPVYVGKAVQGTMPQWDCLHPGRAWAGRLQPCVNTAEQLAERVDEYLRNLR